MTNKEKKDSYIQYTPFDMDSIYDNFNCKYKIGKQND